MPLAATRYNVSLFEGATQLQREQATLKSEIVALRGRLDDTLRQQSAIGGAAATGAARELRARSAAEELTQRHTPVRFERSIYNPEDEICFFVRSPSGDDTGGRDRGGLRGRRG